MPKVIRLNRGETANVERLKEISRWLLGAAAADWTFSPPELFDKIDDPTFEALIGLLQPLGKTDPEVFCAALRTVLRSAIAVLNPYQVDLLLKAYEAALHQNPQHRGTLLHTLAEKLPDLDTYPLSRAFGIVAQHLAAADPKTNRPLLIVLLRHYWKPWNTTDPWRIFDTALKCLFLDNPVELGESMARSGEPLGLPRPSLLEEMADGQDSAGTSKYRQFWQRANGAYRKLRQKQKRDRRLLGRFRQNRGLYRRTSDRILREAEAMQKQGFHAAAVVWSCTAFEVFLTRVLVRSAVQGMGLKEPESVDQLMQDFFRGGPGSDKLEKFVRETYKISFPQAEWAAFKSLLAVRNNIVHQGSFNPRSAQRRQTSQSQGERTSRSRWGKRDVNRALWITKKLIHRLAEEIETSLTESGASPN